MKSAVIGFLMCFCMKAVSSVVPSSEIPDRREFPINESVNPCNDFYQYTCSKVIQSFKLRDDRSRHTFSFSDSAERLLKAKKDYLKNLPQQKEKTSGEVELSDYYQACMNTEARKEEEKAYVANTVSSVEALVDRESFQKFVGSKVGKSEFSFLDFGTVPNQEKPAWEDVYIVGDLRGLPERSYYKNRRILRDYTKLIQNFFKTLGYKDYKKRAYHVVRFETEFDQTYPTPVEWRALISKPSEITRERLLTDYKEFALNEFLEKIPKKTLIRDFTPKTYNFLKKSLAERNLDALKSVYLYHALSGVMDEAYPKFYKNKFNFRKKHLGGSKKRQDLGERCTRLVMSKFTKELDYELYDKLFGDFSKSKFVKLVKKVKKSLISDIKNNDWLSEKGKKHAVKKMKTAFLQVVKPNTKKEWDFNYKADYASQGYIKNNMLWEDKQNEKSLDSLTKSQSNKTWAFGPLTVNAYYHPMQNKFVMPAGILQYPFYDQNLPEHVNLGAVGAVIGHELGHGVDDSGSKFDYKGRLNQWMTEADLKEFEKRGAVLIKQFEAVGHNGKLTLGENIGDLVGVTAAYKAAFPKNKGEQKAKQEFFIQYGRAWCGVMRPGRRKKQLKTDPHALGEARVNEQVKHQKAFSEAFNCKAGDKMFLSDAERVRIW